LSLGGGGYETLRLRRRQLKNFQFLFFCRRRRLEKFNFFLVVGGGG
jgi:hypothetical protein